MQSPRIEWALLAGYVAAVDYLRDRGEPDGDTASEVLRTIYRVDQAPGRAALAASVAAGGLILYRHLTKEAARGAV